MNFNKEYVLNFAKEILAIPSPTGYCKQVVDRVVEEAKKFNLEVERTKKGNAIFTVPGKTNYTVGIAVHVDTLGAMVRTILSDGGLKFSSLGGVIQNVIDGEYCEVITRSGKKYTGTILSTSPAAHVYSDARTKARDDENMYVRLDEKVTCKGCVEKLGIEAGDFIAFDPKTVVTPSGFIKSKFLDDKICVAAIFGLIEYMQRENITPNYTIKYIISTYEEVGHGNAFIPTLDELISVDMGCVGKDLKCTEFDVSICAKDGSGPYDYDVVSRLKHLAVENKINHAVDVYMYYSSDTTAALRGGHDFKGGVMGPGVHASHGSERTHIDAVVATMQLLLAYVK